MKLPFRYQFLLAPAITVLILILLVAYTLIELSKIYAVNEKTKNWEVLTDRVQIAIASINRLSQVVSEMPLEQRSPDNDQYFRYLEQANIVYDTLFEPELHAQLPASLSADIEKYESLLREPERESPQLIVESINSLLPALEYQYKLFVAQRRSNFIDSHRQIVAISIRMTIILLGGLLLCIALAIGFTIWGLRVTRHRLSQLTHRAHSVSTNSEANINNRSLVKDELDDLAICLANMTQRVLSIVSAENILRGAENERRRIAMDMHDGVLADLTAINRKLHHLQDSTSTNQTLLPISNDVNAVIDALRRTIDDLHPQVLDTLGLEASLRSLLDRRRSVAAFPEFHLEFSGELENSLSMEQKLALFRIIGEAISNAVNHSACERIEISLRRVGGQLIVTVEDNGVGINEAEIANGHGFANIKERAQFIGASVQWRHSRFSSGTCFELTMLLNAND